MNNTKPQQDSINILYWLSDVMTNGDTRTLSNEQVKLVKELQSLLDLDPRYKYSLDGNVITKSHVN